MVKNLLTTNRENVDILCPSLVIAVVLIVEPSAKGQDPYAQGADMTQHSACAALSEEQWTHLRENFTKRSVYSSMNQSLLVTISPGYPRFWI